MTERTRRRLLWLALAGLLAVFVGIDWIYLFRQ